MLNDTSWKMIGVPIDCSGRFVGTHLMADALRSVELPSRLGVEDLGNLPVTINSSERDLKTGIIALPQVQSVSEAICTQVSGMLMRKEKPLVIGGCCTVLVGICAALKQQFGDVGLFFVDGHLDYFDGKASPSGEMSDMELRVVLGRGDEEISNLPCVSGPFIKAEYSVVCGFRDETIALREGSPDIRQELPQVSLFDLKCLRERGVNACAQEIASFLEKNQLPFWLHIDVDVLNSECMPAVDYPMPDGLNWQELRQLVQPALKSPLLVGVDITILNPKLDPDGRYSRATVENLELMFGD